MKEKIIQKAIELFNQKGFFDVSLRDIAKALDIRIGSLTYHFKTKKDLMDSIYRYMIKTIDEMSISDRLFQKKGEEVNVARVYFKYMQQFRFFFQDTLDIIRAFPEIGEKHQQQVKEEVNIVINMLYMQVGKGTLKPEPLPGIYTTLAEMIWQTLHFWFVRQAIFGNKQASIDKILEIILHLIYPYLSEQRKSEGLTLVEMREEII